MSTAAVPLLRREVYVDERGIDDGVAERIRGMTTKAFGEVGTGLEPVRDERPAVHRRRRVGWRRSGLTPATRRRRGRCRPRPNGRGAPGTGLRRRRERCRSSSRTRRAATGRRRLGRRSALPRSRPTSKRIIASMALASAQRWGARLSSTARGLLEPDVDARRRASPRHRARAGQPIGTRRRASARPPALVCAQCSARVESAEHELRLGETPVRRGRPGRVPLGGGLEEGGGLRVRLGALLDRA